MQCAVTLESYLDYCVGDKLEGGLLGFVIAKCDHEFTLITDTMEWETAMTAGDVAGTSMVQIIGEFPEADEFTRKLSSAWAEDILGFRHSAHFIDHNAEKTTFQQDLFYNFLNANYRKLKFGFVGPDDIFYGFITGATVVSKRVREQNTEDGLTFWDTMIRWNDKSFPVPQVITGLTDLFTAA